MAMTKVKNLQLWCKKMCEGYRDVEVRDMASSWKSGLVFCAIIHRFRPDLIDYDSLSKENVFENNQLAFEVAEKQLNIPAFLEAADMVAIRVPDRLSVVTYVSQYYNYFHNKPQLGGPGVNTPVVKSIRRTQDVDQKKLGPAHQNAGENPVKRDRQESIGDKCTICHEKVYLLERQIELGKLYHRACFRKSEMSPTSKVFKRPPYSTLEEEKREQSGTKARKLHNGSESVSKTTTEPDIWQRRAQQKAKEAKEQEERAKGTLALDTMETDKKAKAGTKERLGEVKDSRAKSPTETMAESILGKRQTDHTVPSWKQNMAARELTDSDKRVPDKGEPIQTSGYRTKHDQGADTKRGGPNLANKFKELNERNLKQTEEDSKPGAYSLHKEGKKGAKSSDASGLGKASSTETKKSHDFGGSRSPRAKHRHKVDKEDSDEPKTVHPKAAPRQTKQDIKIISPKTYRKAVPRSKSPPMQKDLEFLVRNVSPRSEIVSSSIEVPSSPPPLPSSRPPALPASAPPKLDIPRQVGPSSKPETFTVKTRPSTTYSTSKDTEPVIPPRPSSVALPPTKPARVSQNIESTTRSASPMETEPTPAKAIFHNPVPEHKAVLVAPKLMHAVDDEKKDREVLGGLLKSLAGVKGRQDGASKVSSSGDGGSSSKDNVMSRMKEVSIPRSHSPIQEEESHKPVPLYERNTGKTGQRSTVNDSLGDKINAKPKPPRPKSSFVSGTATIFSSNQEQAAESHLSRHQGFGNRAEDTTAKPVVEADKKQDAVPEWKKRLEKQRAERAAKAKSAELLNKKEDHNTNSVPEWKREAEKRIVARKGQYIDPETNKVETGEEVSLTRPLSPPLSPTVSPTVSPKRKENKQPVPQQRRFSPKPPADQTPKKKIGLDQTFTFEEEEIILNPKRPPRPAVAPASPTGKSPTPTRPPPPQQQASKRKMSPHDIQRQLQKIDRTLTNLELKGRQLEDSIRGARGDEEDELMIDWFHLVNDKNELVRTEADLIYISRAQELEEEQHEIDQQLRELAGKTEQTVSKTEKELEKFLIKKHLDVIDQRNYIVQSIDEDRLRYLEEDRDIEEMLKEKGFLKNNDSGKVLKEKKTSKLLG